MVVTQVRQSVASSGESAELNRMLVNERSSESVVRSTATQGGNSEPRSRPEKFSKVSIGLKRVAPQVGKSARGVPA
jgi:hypothetical protein